MSVNNIFSAVNSIGRALDVRQEKQGLIQSNIANIETPGYKVQDFSFKAVMEGVTANKGQLAKTDPRHIQLDPVFVSEGLEVTQENRPVDLDEEMLKLSENQLMYQVTAQIVRKKFEGLNFAIDEGGK